jgi:YjbE family integral membrane protein
VDFSLYAPQLIAFLQVVVIDLVLAGDNAVVVGMAAAGLPKDQRLKAVGIGIAVATIARIAFALVATQLLQIIGLLLAGGLLLLWVAWKMWQEIRASQSENDDSDSAEAPPRKTFRQAVLQIVLADLSMSLDNVLAVAGAARDHYAVLVIGLVLSVSLMGVAAQIIAGFINRHRWAVYIGFGVVLYVALKMVYEGGMEIAHATGAVG